MIVQERELEYLRTALLELTPSQQVAIEALASGATHQAAAKASGVTRETVTRWAGHLPAFKACLNLYRCSIVAEQIDIARRIRGKALASVEEALDSGDIDALAVLKALGDSPLATGPTIPEEILDRETNKTRDGLLPAPFQGLDAILESLTAPSQSDSERAEALTILRIAEAAGIYSRARGPAALQEAGEAAQRTERIKQGTQ